MRTTAASASRSAVRSGSSGPLRWRGCFCISDAPPAAGGTVHRGQSPGAGRARARRRCRAAARFTDVTEASGIDFVHHNGAYGEKLLPETMAAAVAVIDVANDGRADLLFVDSGSWPWKAAQPRYPT